MKKMSTKRLIIGCETVKMLAVELSSDQLRNMHGGAGTVPAASSNIGCGCPTGSGPTP